VEVLESAGVLQPSSQGQSTICLFPGDLFSMSFGAVVGETNGFMGMVESGEVKSDSG